MLKIYKNKTPNQPNGLHYVFSNFSNYLAELGTPFLQFTLDNYRINGGTIEVATSAPYSDVDAITYVIDNRDNYNRCYFVDYAEIQSGYLVLRVHVDWWASYLYKATVSNLRVTRCNRNVGIGVYDPIQATKGASFELLDSTRNFNVDDLAIVYTVAFATGLSSIFVNNSGTQLGLFATELSALQHTPEGVSKIDWAIKLVSGIYSANATIGDLDAGVLNAFFIPKAYLAIKSGSVPVFKTKPPEGEFTLTPEFEVAPLIFPVTINKAINPNFEYYVGTKLSGLKMTRTTESQIQIRYEFIAKQDGFQVIVRQGSQMLDITDAFSVGLTSNDGSLTYSQKIAKGIQGIGSVASGAFQIMKGGAGYVTGALQITSAISNVIEQGNAKYSQGGDGVSTFRLLSGAAGDPFYCTKYESTDDEQAHARLFGATFNQQVASIDSVFTFPYLGSGTAETYLAATCEIDGICMNARDDIISQLKEGVYIKKL